MRRPRWLAAAVPLAVLGAMMIGTPAHAAAAGFASSFEAGQPQPDWTDTTERAEGVDGTVTAGMPGSLRSRVAAIAVDLLTEMGLAVTAVDSGPRALEALARASFDIMLSDIVMPGGMTGVELARKAAAEWPDMRIVLASGYAGDDMDATLKDAPWPFLKKPYSADELRAILGEPG